MGLDHYERLEWLGDAALDLLVMDYIVAKFGALVDENEDAKKSCDITRRSLPGRITKIKALVVCNPAYAYLACKCGYSETLFHSSDEFVVTRLEQYRKWVSRSNYYCTVFPISPCSIYFFESIIPTILTNKIQGCYILVVVVNVYEYWTIVEDVTMSFFSFLMSHIQFDSVLVFRQRKLIW